MLRRLRVMDRILHPDISQETIGEVLARPDVCRSIAAVFRDERDLQAVGIRGTCRQGAAFTSLSWGLGSSSDCKWRREKKKAEH